MSVFKSFFVKINDKYMECLGAPYFFGGYMNKCHKCGHKCHCGKECPDCVNDVCYVCDCDYVKNKDAIPGSMLNGL